MNERPVSTVDFEKLAQSDNPADLDKVITAYERRSQLQALIWAYQGKTTPEAVFARAVAEGLLADTTKYPVVPPLTVMRAHQNILEGNLKVRWYYMLEAREDGASWAQIAETVGMASGSNAGHIARTWYLTTINALTVQEFGGHEARARAVVDDPPADDGIQSCGAP